MATTAARPGATRLGPVALVLVLPLVGLAVLIGQPELDLVWEHHPSHFWIVLIAAAVNVVLSNSFGFGSTNASIVFKRLDA